MEPLASRLRPETLDDFVGQEHLVGEGKPLRVATLQGHLFSFLLWGPPGVGKTTLARIYAKGLDAKFYELSAVSAGKGDIKAIVDEDAGEHPKVLFLDEIHRFNKAQQDYLLPHVESGKLTLIGATTENPSFEVISALLSRCRVFVLNELTAHDMRKIIARAEVKIDLKARDWLIAMSGGDARIALSVLDQTIKLYKTPTIEHLKQAIQSKHLRYDQHGEEHHNTISAFIKSMRAGQSDAAIYYLARMVEAGEDPLFIARRMVIFASEDIGLAQPTALVVANAVFRACETIGYPECAINLVHGVAYLAGCKKDRSAYAALLVAKEDVSTYGNLPIPLNIRNAPTKLMKELGYGEGYEKYDKVSYLPEELKKKTYLKKRNGEEKK
ncbi:MAG: AAA family ATPase [Candidatus Lloydbacteria bacterium RIFCSPLOWO2_01_FULL_50_20]|uniref:AAA family ATPase n=1 Tax=Candidatus Lloydbacteria bacterium RIFCSPLOWO2_01_FULL_50_20 TaxID=1798665 RepID=A0A1G2DF73_9BACT|nr:MAG: AAA family ATPase [Candidatus Lloydbacteria bacterium RIFCSPHIGHO2_02_FULL_50_11]OGZ12259.1 MAG: AAA family ATPase [Candidatus Lloydbacteria bacterium RIFCSPLOWO2_01_FULL_50_20]